MKIKLGKQIYNPSSNFIYVCVHICAYPYPQKLYPYVLYVVRIYMLKYTLYIFTIYTQHIYLSFPIAISFFLHKGSKQHQF